MGVLKSSVAVKQWMCVGIRLNCCIQCIKDKRKIIGIADDKRNNSPVIEIKNRTQI